MTLAVEYMTNLHGFNTIKEYEILEDCSSALIDIVQQEVKLKHNLLVSTANIISRYKQFLERVDRHRFPKFFYFGYNQSKVGRFIEKALMVEEPIYIQFYVVTGYLWWKKYHGICLEIKSKDGIVVQYKLGLADHLTYLHMDVKPEKDLSGTPKNP